MRVGLNLTCVYLNGVIKTLLHCNKKNTSLLQIYNILAVYPT